ncbi:MAG: SAM-dependent methyltransferase [Pirellulaceae bacterium]
MSEEVAAKFLFTCCQVGAESALKAEIARRHPRLRFAYSRPGFVTFKLPGQSLPEDFDLGSVFARAWGLSLGRLSGDHAETLAQQTWQLAGDRDYRYLHVWQRDAAVPGDHGFEPGVTPLADEVGRLIAEARPAHGDEPSRKLPVNLRAHSGDLVLDCVLVEPNEWWIGTHRATTTATRVPGGVIPVEMPPEAVSRAYLKMEEALRWARLPMEEGDHVVEIGSAPGGSCQALLARGLMVTGIDPSEMAPEVVAHPEFVHVKARAADIKRRDFREVRWLTADSNVAPKHTLDTVEAIVTHADVHVRGLILTLKLLDWSLAEQIPAYLERIRSWGFRYLRARQLAHNRQEICVVALRRRSLRRKSLLAKRTRRKRTT